MNAGSKRISFITEGLPRKITVNNLSIKKNENDVPVVYKRTGTAFPCVPVRLGPCIRIILLLEFLLNDSCFVLCTILRLTMLSVVVVSAQRHWRISQYLLVIDGVLFLLDKVRDDRAFQIYSESCANDLYWFAADMELSKAS